MGILLSRGMGWDPGPGDGVRGPAGWDPVGLHPTGWDPPDSDLAGWDPPDSDPAGSDPAG